VLSLLTLFGCVKRERDSAVGGDEDRLPADPELFDPHRTCLALPQSSTDENGNGVLDKNFFGVPVEGYGFSNDARGSMGPPAFEKAAFRHDPTR
jgi:Uncharacterized protein conserved in bacteria (DUF2141)